MIVKIKEPFFRAPAGSIAVRVDGTYDTEVCDVCGKKRKCDWYEWRPGIAGMTGMDICRSCAKSLEVKE